MTTVDHLDLKKLREVMKKKDALPLHPVSAVNLLDEIARLRVALGRISDCGTYEDSCSIAESALMGRQ